MQTDDEKTLADRIASLERAVADLARSFDTHLRDAGARQAATEPVTPSAAPPPMRNAPSLEPKGAEWWLARGGALLTLFALVLLYQYAVSRNWITPVLRIGLGTALGVVLMVSGARVTRAPGDAPDDAVGLREMLMGAALSAWFITAYAAAVFYGLISLPMARMIFLMLSIAGAWLALREKRALLGFLSLAAGFAAPALLPSPTSSIPTFALYLGALTAVGLILYLMRGWQSVLWLTFGAFWSSAGSAAAIACCSAAGGDTITGSITNARVALTVLIALMAMSMARVPILRRRLLALGSHLYTESNRSEAGNSILTELANKLSRFIGQPAAVDSPALWAITLASPLIAVAQFSIVWPRQSSLVWGSIALVAAALAYRLASSPRAPDEEFTHVEAAATALWSLAGMLWIADGIASQLRVSSIATYVVAASLHAFFAFAYVRESRFIAPGRLARVTAAALIISVFFRESEAPRSVNLYWTFAEICGIAVAAWSAWLYRMSSPKTYAILIGVASYLALMTVDARVLGTIFRPLVTASYALVGTGLLIVSRSSSNQELLRRVGGFTLVIVIARLLLVDMAGVETIWRVLLFLGCGALFLLASHRVRAPRKPSPATTGPVI